MKMPHVLSLIIAGLLIACIENNGTDDAEVQSDIESGWAFFDEGKYDKAKEKFNEALEIQSKNVKALCGLGWSECRLNKMEEGISRFSEALKNDESNLSAHLGMGFAYSAQHKHDKSISSLKEGLELMEEPFSPAKAMTIGKNDVRDMLSIAYYLKKDVENLKTQVTGKFPENKIKEKDSNSWKVDDLKMNKYEDALLFTILD